MRDLFQEIWSAVSNNRLRTALTGFAVSWGIFLLICLLGAGNGIIHSFIGNSDRFVKNSIVIYGGFTSKPYAGYQTGRRIILDGGDVNLTETGPFGQYTDFVAPVTESISVTMKYGASTMTGYLSGITPSYLEIEKVQIKYGRAPNPTDVEEKRKVLYVSDFIVKELLGLEGEEAAKAIGERISLNNLSYRIVCIYQTDESNNSQEIFAPYSTVRDIYFNGKDEIGAIYFTFHGLDNVADNKTFEHEYTSTIKKHHDADPEDPRALWVWNRFTDNIEMKQAADIITLALWIIGVLTLISGIVGVSNIMLISVKERTHEFGIRKAIGARPGSILKLIITESVSITAFFGYIGMLLGMIACEIMDKTIGQRAVDVGFEKIHMLENPTVGLNVAVEATLLLIAAGTLAGLFPARKASRVRPIEALRAD